MLFYIGATEMDNDQDRIIIILAPTHCGRTFIEELSAIFIDRKAFKRRMAAMFYISKQRDFGDRHPEERNGKGRSPYEGLGLVNPENGSKYFYPELRLLRIGNNIYLMSL